MLDENLRAQLKKPFGHLCKKGKCSERLNKFDKIISVGDITTYNVLQCGIVPNICITDDITMRKKVPEEIRNRINAERFEVLKVRNAAGSISAELIDGIFAAMKSMKVSKRVRIVVEGEEDLAVIPAVVSAPAGTAVIYGQPGEGMVLVEVTREKKKRAKYLLKMITN
jgi:uncharacterized protein (UPF0218 family)